MPRRCCVPHCKSNYTLKGVTEYVTCFTFPKDYTLRKKWVSNISREDWTPSDTAVVCIKHFEPDCIQREVSYQDSKGVQRVFVYDRPKLKIGSTPTIFKDLPTCVSEKLPFKKRKNPEEWADGRELITGVEEKLAVTHLENKEVTLLDLQSTQIKMECEDNYDVISEITQEEYQEQKFVDELVTGIKQEYEDHKDHSLDVTSEITFEEDPVPVSFPMVKLEPKEEWNDPYTVNQGMKPEVKAEANEILTSRECCSSAALMDEPPLDLLLVSRLPQPSQYCQDCHH
ncbi:uncharacterized protein [Periplaneta americana]|uniref:uncharacterized protein isoform X3 n=1 Tax=Periplaneta americana TaxID=6978 RepID=UPI0037E9118A